MEGKILILGATGTFGRPVTRSLLEKGFAVRVLTRHPQKARRLFGTTVEIVPGDAGNEADLRRAMRGCWAVHISLPYRLDPVVMERVVGLGRETGLRRITYVSATNAHETTRRFEMSAAKLRAEARLRSSGFACTIFCPTWAMETLPRFVRGGWGLAIGSLKSTPIHFVAGEDFGRMVAASYEDDRALGKRLFIHGPEAVPLPEALIRFVRACYPDLHILRLLPWQARLIAALTGRRELAEVARLIAYFDEVGELGDPSEANALLGGPTVTLQQWIERQKARVLGTRRER